MLPIDILRAFVLGFAIGLTGALVPGPMLFATIELSLKKGWTAGPEIFLGHMFIEFFLCMLIFMGATSFFGNGVISAISLIGGLALMVFGVLTVKNAKNEVSSVKAPGDLCNVKIESFPAIIGLVTSVSNPYFWIWWLTAGSALIIRGYELGIIIAVAYVLGHWTADLSWFTAVSGSFSRGKSLFHQKTHKYILYVCGIFLTIFGFYFLINYNDFGQFA